MREKIKYLAIKCLYDPKISAIALFLLIVVLPQIVLGAEANGSESIKTTVNEGLKNVYRTIVGISTGVAVVATSIAALICRMSKNTQTVEEGWEWMKRVWTAWAIINGITLISSFFSEIIPKEYQWEQSKP